MVRVSLKKNHLGAVIAFKLPEYYVYGVVIDEDQNSGDSLLMFAPKFRTPLESLDDLYLTSIRCKFLFFYKLATLKRNRDVMSVAGRLDLGRLPPTDRRFRFILPLGTGHPKWQIRDEGTTTLTPVLTQELALLSDAVIPNLDYMRQYYDADYYPWSAPLTSRGPTNFDTKKFEETMRAQMQP